MCVCVCAYPSTACFSFRTQANRSVYLPLATPDDGFRAGHRAQLKRITKFLRRISVQVAVGLWCIALSIFFTFIIFIIEWLFFIFFSLSLSFFSSLAPMNFSFQHIPTRYDDDSISRGDMHAPTHCTIYTTDLWESASLVCY